MGVPRHALLLTAGLGTRLRPLSLVRAKAAMPVAGEPLARRTVRWLVERGVTDLVANLHHLPATLTAALGDGSDLGARIRYSWEHPTVLGSAGGPRQALDILGAETFLMVNGDTLTDVDLAGLAGAHEAVPGTRATLALVPNREPRKYGGVSIDAENRVTGYVPRGVAAEGSWHFIGVQMVEASAFRDLPAQQPASSIGGVYDRLMAAHPGSIRAFPSDASYWDIGTVDDYWRTWFAFARTRPARGQSILWDRVEIGPGSTLDECILTDDVRVPAGARYRRQILVKTPTGEVSATPFDPPSAE